MKAVVFGGDGYIGRHLENLTRSFDEVVLVDHRQPSAADVEYADVREPIPIEIAGGSPPDWIVLVAAVHREPGHRPHEYFETNLKGARSIAAYADAVGCKNIFFVSSSSVYGAMADPTDEQTIPCPNSAYGCSKLCAELILGGWQAAHHDRRLVICRPGVVYGPGDPGNVLRMIRAIRRGLFVIPGTRRVHKSYAYIAGLIDSVDFTVARSEPFILYNYVERETETLGRLVGAIQDEFRCRRPVPSLPTAPVVAAAYAIQTLTRGRSVVHPVRVKKAAQPTHVVPRWLIENGFDFRFDFRSSLTHWRSVAPQDFDLPGRVAPRPLATRTRIAEVPAVVEYATPPPAAVAGVREGSDTFVRDLAALQARFPRVALVHDWLTVPGGSEQVLAALLELFPGGEIFTSVYDPEPWPPTIRERVVHASFVGRVPRANRLYPRLLPLMRQAFRSFDFHEFDLILSSSHAFAKSAVGNGQPHVCYCHTPLRLLWEPRFLARESIGPLSRGSAALLRSRLRRVDRQDAGALDAIMANSSYTAERIRRYWDRSATVVHPPVVVERFLEQERRAGPSYVVLGRVVPYKRVDLAVAACARLGRPVTVVGEGRGLAQARAAAGRGARFLGRVSDGEVESILSEARAVICCADEDFGIVPVEAQAAGVPVIAYGVGGHRDSVEDGRHGVLFAEQTVEAVTAAIERFEGLAFDSEVLRANAARFSTPRFHREVVSVLAPLAADHEAQRPVDMVSAASSRRLASL
ncbi:MAG: NAD-dependent epimerase/dehydratase family protein [Actinomycetota bacterium]|nr:NAD-dependent epimerase/dehydratase family protein [Actinomycetota bacterium]